MLFPTNSFILCVNLRTALPINGILLIIFILPDVGSHRRSRLVYYFYFYHYLLTQSNIHILWWTSKSMLHLHWPVASDCTVHMHKTHIESLLLPDMLLSVLCSLDWWWWWWSLCRWPNQKRQNVLRYIVHDLQFTIPTHYSEFASVCRAHAYARSNAQTTK